MLFADHLARLIADVYYAAGLGRHFRRAVHRIGVSDERQRTPRLWRLHRLEPGASELLVRTLHRVRAAIET